MFGVIESKPRALPALRSGKVGEQEVALRKEYAELSTKLGLPLETGLGIRLDEFLSANDLPVYNMAEVIRHMDRKARWENPNKTGWNWRPLRTKDSLGFQFGNLNNRVQSNYYHPHADDCRSVYDHRVPLHALRIVEKIESGLALGQNEKIAFMVSDYNTAPQRDPDPFLLAIFLNTQTHQNARRVVDFWDEPGFGIESMLKGQR